MPERGDVTVDPVQRLITVAAPSTEITIQDLHDTLVNIEDEIDFLQWPKLISSAGKEVLDATTKVGITATLQACKLAFEARNTADQIGTVTTVDTSGVTLKDSAATFLANGIHAGSAVVNFTDKSVGTVYRVNSETELELVQQLVGGADNQFDLADDYRVFNIDVCRVSGGNLVAVDSAGDPETPFQATFGVAFDRTTSASATQTDQDAIQYASFSDVVTVDAVHGAAGTDYPLGNQEYPVDNIPDAVIIANERGFTVLSIRGNITLDTGDNVTGLVIAGQGPIRSTFIINVGANTLNCTFNNATIEGNLDGNSQISDCTVGDLNYIEGAVKRSLINGTILLTGSAETHIVDCWSDCGGNAFIDMGGSGRDLVVHRFSGMITVKNLTGANNASLGLVSGRAVIDATVTAGIVSVGGICALIDNHGGTAVVYTDGLVNTVAIVDGVLGGALAAHGVYGTVGHSMQKIEYNNQVCIDPLYGNSGTTFPRGTYSDPVNNWADAKAIAESLGAFLVCVKNTLTLGATDNISNYIFCGENCVDSAIVVTDGCATQNTTFNDTSVEGYLDGRVNLRGCVVHSLYDYKGYAFNTLFLDNITIEEDTKTTIMSECIGGKFGGNPVEVDVGDNGLMLMGWKGPVELTGKTGTDITYIEVLSGQVKVSDTCVAGEITIKGLGRLAGDQSGVGCTVVTRDLTGVVTIADAVLQEVVADHIATAGSLAELIDGTSKMLVNRSKVDTSTSQLIVYEADGIAEWRRFDWKDASGLPATTDVFERDPV